MPRRRSTTVPAVPRRHQRQTRRDRQRRKTWILASCGAALLLVLGSAALVAQHALSAKSSLEAAVTEVQSVQASLSSFDTSTLDETYTKLHENTSHAADMTSGWVWGAYEHLPIVGANLVAFRQTADLVNNVVTDGLGPVAKAANGVSIDSLKPVDGAINLAPIRKLSPAVVKAAAAFDQANQDAQQIDTSATIDALSSKVDELKTMMKKASGAIQPAAKLVPLISPLLGGDSPRNYLMIFQNNAEVRAEGGNPAALVLLTVDKGKIEIARQASSTDFHNGRSQPVMELSPDVQEVYSKIVGTWVPNITSTPNFPTTAALAKAYWAEEFDDKIDGVISFDPVALQYILHVTGPVTLETGETLTAENAVPMLLNDVYFRYPDPKVQDAFFAAAANSIFGAVTSGKGNTMELVDALVKSTNEGRLMFWSANKAEQKVALESRLGGVLPADNAKSTVVGAYFNDVTGSKMDYYVDAKVDVSSTQCTAGKATFTEKITLTNGLDPALASGLPLYVTGKYYTPGHIGTDVVAYGPVGSTIDSWTSTTDATEKATGTIDGRPVSRVLVKLAPRESTTITFTMTGATKAKYGPLEAHTTPMVRETPVTVSAPGCESTK